MNSIDMVLRHYIKLKAREAIALEKISDLGVTRRELEYTFYGKLNNIAELDANCFKKEAMEQWLIPINSKVDGKARIRAIGDVGKGEYNSYVLTTKLKQAGVLGCTEVECNIPKDMYMSLKNMGTGGYKKIRYYFQIPNSRLIWEIDAFYTQLGQLSEWVKIDLEVSSPADKIPKTPVNFDSIISHQHKDLTRNELEVINHLWDELWVSLDS